LTGLDRYVLGRSLLEATHIELQLEAEKLMGQLPMGAAGQSLLKQQYEAALRVKDRASAYLERYATELPTQSIQHNLDMPWGHVCISAEIEGLRQGQKDFLQLTVRPGAVATGKKDQQTARPDILMKLWPKHVLLCAAGWSVQSVAVGLDGVAVLPAIKAEHAQQLLSQWIAAYTQAWQRPLPVTFKAGLAFVTEQNKLMQSDKEIEASQVTELALEKASKAFVDSYAEDTDFGRSLYVQRSFDNFDPLKSGLPEWAFILYADLVATAVMEGVSA
jgi:exonuclease V gamma subunit